MLLQSHFPFAVLNRKTIFSKKNLYFLRLLFAFTKIFEFNTVKLPKVKNNLSEEMNPEWDCID